tara:strand:- start:3171 stop:4001 length:831 start_codon:yes stop_codon:yes gene_type:complete
MWSRGEAAKPLRQHLESRGHRVHCPTLPGHKAGSTTQVDQLSLQDYADTICGFIDSKSFETPPVLIGHSMGGLITQMVASRLEINSMVLLNSAGPAGVNHILPTAVATTIGILLKPFFWKRSQKPGWKAVRFGILNEVEITRAREIYQNFVPESGRAFGELVFWFLDPNRTTTLPIPGPRISTLIISGGRDRITSPPVARALAKVYPHADVQTYPDHGHWIFEEPGREEVFQKMLEWIEFREDSSHTHLHHGVTKKKDSEQSKSTYQPPSQPKFSK